MKGNPSQSPLSSTQLRQTPERFEHIFGFGIGDFDNLLQSLHDHIGKRTTSITEEELAEEVSIALLSMRQSMTQEVLSACFGREESAVGEIIERICPLITAVLLPQEAPVVVSPSQHPNNAEYLRSLLDTSAMYVIRTDVKGRYSYANRSFLETFVAPKDRENINGVPSLTYIIPEDHAITFSTVEQCFANPGKHIYVKLRKPTVDGAILTTEWEFTTIADANGIVSEIQCTGWDITEQLRIQKELLHAKQLLDETGMIGRIGGWEYLVQSNTLEWTKETYDIYEIPYSSNLSIAEGIRHYHVDDRETIANAFSLLSSKGEAFDLELRFTTAKGKVLWVRSIGKCEYDANNAISRLYGTFHDITERKTHQQRQEIERSIAEILTQSISLDTAAPLIIKTICEHLDWDYGELWEMNENDDSKLTFSWDWHKQTEALAKFETESREFVFDSSIGVPRSVWEHHQPIWISDIASSDIPLQRRILFQEVQLRTLAAFPISLENKSLGILVFLSHKHREADEPMMELITSIGGHIGQFVIRKHAEEALRKSEAVFRSALQSLSEGIVVQDTSAAIHICNSHAEQILGLSADQLMGRTSLDPRWRSIHEDGSPFPGETHPVPLTLKTGKPQHNVIMGVHKSDDTLSWISINAEPIFLEGQTEIYGAIATFTDITERKQAEELLKASYRDVKNFRSALEATALISITDTQGKIVYANEQFVALSQYTAQELIGNNHRMINSGYHDTEFFKTMWQTITSGEPWRGEIRNRAKDGSYYWVDAVISPMFDEHGEVYQYMAVRYDITGRKQSEEALRQSEERFRSIIDVSPVPYALNDEHGNITYLNPAFTGTFGYDLTDIPELSDWWVRAYPDDKYRKWVMTTWQEHLEKAKEEQTSLEPMELDIQCKNGRSRSLLVSAAPLRGTLQGTHLVILYDITERKIAEQDLRELNQTLEQRVEKRTRELVLLNNEKNEFLGIAAHDLKNPLSGILSSAEILERYYGGEAQTKRYVSMIVSASEQMLDIIENLLDVNKIESGLLKVHIIPISLEVIAAVVEDYQQRATSKGIILRYLPALEGKTVPTVLADEQALWQVMDNLVSNAVKYSPHWKSVSVRVLSRTDEEGKCFGRVEIQDEGPGISEADMHKLFDKFTRLSAQPTGGENSTGLGLSIVKKLVELQHGQVWCESELGKGATFIVEFPCA